jgi:signal transduction histidine kinase
VCELNDTNDQLEETIKYAEELNTSKDRFITVLSHDLRSPFQGLLGITKTLTTEYDSFTDEEKRFYITQVNNSVEKIYSFLEELLLWGRVQKNAVKLTYESTIIKELIYETVSLLSESTRKKKITIETVCDGFLSAVLDKEMIAIVLRNLISNAIKFSTVGGKILVSAELEMENIKITITDYGVGISEDTIPKLFKLDENITTIGTDGEQGSGMGLILCNDILKKHNGQISVQSKEGRGSTFTIIIPRYNN